MKTKFNAQGFKDNAHHIAGVLIGLTLLKLTGTRYNKSDRGTKSFSTVAANLAADGFIRWTPFPVFFKVPA